jgi:hypothetical protein
MTIVAMAHWLRLDREGTDRCTLSRASHGWLLSGQANWREDAGEVSLSYAVRCGPDWQSLSADITGTGHDGDIGLRLARDTDGWRVNDKLQPGTQGCTDLDLCFTPATNLMPLRRIFRDGEPLAVAAAWVPPGLNGLRNLKQRYTPMPDGTVVYSSPGFTAPLTVHETGFVTHYPDLWEGWVDGT